MKINKKINLTQLENESKANGLNAVLDEEGNIIEITLADNSSINETELKSFIDKHLAFDDEKNKSVSKTALLEKLGITEEEAKLLLS